MSQTSRQKRRHMTSSTSSPPAPSSPKKRQRTVATWNMQGGTGWPQVTSLVNQSDVLSLQESGTPHFLPDLQLQPSGIYTGEVNFGTRSRPKKRHVAHWPNTINSHPRNSLTLLSKDPIQGASMLPAPSPSLRPGLMVKTDDMNIVNIHAPSGNHNAAAAVSSSILRGANQPFLALGDFNFPPEVMQQKTGFSVTSSQSATQQSGNQLDYAVHSSNISGSLKPTPVMSDHFAQLGSFAKT